MCLFVSNRLVLVACFVIFTFASQAQLMRVLNTCLARPAVGATGFQLHRDESSSAINTVAIQSVASEF